MKADRTKEQLLLVALRHFGEKGFNATSVREICLEARANVSAIKYHFGSKEELYRACFKNYGENQLQSALKILTPAKTRPELKNILSHFCSDFIANSLTNPHLFKMIMREIEAENPLIQDIFQETFLKIHSTVVGIFEDAKVTGLIRKDTDSLVAAATLFNTLTTRLRLDHIAMKHFQTSLNQLEHRQKYIEQLILILTDGIFIRSTSHES